MNNNDLRRKFVDGLRAPHRGVSRGARMKQWIAAHAHKTPVLIAFASLLILSNSVIYLAAFEAHVVNVTATIERPPTQCNALSVGYWRNHEGCTGGEGESDWTNEIHVITTEFSGIFYNITGAEICEALWTPNCPSGNNILSKRCKATAMALGDELNLVSGHLDIDALIAGADDGSSAFDHLGLTYNSTIRQALTKVEQIIGNPNSTTGQLTDAAYVAERIYAFYEDENPNAPQCVTDPKEAKQCSVETTYIRESGHTGNSSDEDEEENGGEHENQGGSNSDSGNDRDGKDKDKNSSADESGNNEEQNSSGSSDGESEHDATSTDETVPNSEEGSEVHGEQIIVPEESTAPTTTSIEEHITP